MKTFLPVLLGAGLLVSAALAQTGAPVAITESAADYVLANGVITARVLKRNGDLASLKFPDAEMLNDKSGHPGAYWSHDTTGGTELITRITIDPSANGGARAEVSVKGISGGKKMGHGPGVPAGAEGDLPVDIEIRYTLGRGDSGIYTYCAFTHRPEYPAATMTEARFAAKLADTFDWMTVDAKRDKHFPVTLREGDKYIYTATQFDNRAFGWSSSKDRVGFWLLNPSVEFLSGGPTKTESNLLVGLTPATYTSPIARSGLNGAPAARRQIDWQIDARHYQFWSRGDERGNFSIPHVPAGTYTLRALADGVLGEFAQAEVVVKAGQPLDLGSLAWKPVRRGKPLWEIGVPNRTASEFAGADQFWLPEMPLKYATLFPNDVNFVVGQSDPRRDWFFQHVPHNEDPSAKLRPFYGITTPGRATPFAISFDLAGSTAPRGKATLRVAICGGGAREIAVIVNGQNVGKIDRLLVDGAITRHSIRGLWYEREVAFDAALLKPGANTLTLTIPAGPVNNGVIYDCLRLELDESAAGRSE